VGAPDGAHTHGSGGGGGAALPIALIILGALALGAPAAAAAVHLLVIVVTVVVVLAVAGGAGLLVYRLRHPRPPRLVPWESMADRPAPAEVSQGTVHLHLHGVDPADLPAIVAAARSAPFPRPERERQVIRVHPEAGP
jgi:hypothetical protein